MVKINKHSNDWRLVKYQIEQFIASEKDKLTNCKTWEEAKESQGRIAAWRTVLLLEDESDAQD